MYKILYTGFKGKNNASYKLVKTLQGEKCFLTNSFAGLKKDIDVIKSIRTIISKIGEAWIC